MSDINKTTRRRLPFWQVWAVLICLGAAVIFLVMGDRNAAGGVLLGCGVTLCKLALWAEENLPMAFTVFDLPPAHRTRLRTTNGLERITRELKRRTRVASIFPNTAALLRPVSALLAECDEEWMTGKIYLSLEAPVA
jgi:hypothetical protein